MYCVIQVIPRKKPNPYGAYKELVVTSHGIDGVQNYSYSFSYDRFERPIRKAYKISIHKSQRIDGVVTKKQFAVTTAEYYSIADYGIYESIPEGKVEDIAAELGTDASLLWGIIEAKVEPLQARIRAEFQASDEYIVSQKHEKIIADYREAKKKFANDYICDEIEYDRCYDVFGNLMNKDYLDKIIARFRQRCSYRNENRSNYSNSGSKYNWDDFSGYFKSSGGNYTDDEKALLKKFYRTLSKANHPDLGGDTAAMQLINKLKTAWGI